MKEKLFTRRRRMTHNANGLKLYANGFPLKLFVLIFKLVISSSVAHTCRLALLREEARHLGAGSFEGVQVHGLSRSVCGVGWGGEERKLLSIFSFIFLFFHCPAGILIQSGVNLAKLQTFYVFFPDRIQRWRQEEEVRAVVN